MYCDPFGDPSGENNLKLFMTGASMLVNRDSPTISIIFIVIQMISNENWTT